MSRIYEPGMILEKGKIEFFTCGCQTDGFIIRYCSNHSNKPVEKIKREEIKECYDAIHPEFMEMMALLAGHSKEKYGSWEQYMNGRLTGNKSPVTHILAHITQYRKGDEYDRFDKSRKWHLIAIAYNAMMELWYECHPEVK